MRSISHELAGDGGPTNRKASAIPILLKSRFQREMPPCYLLRYGDMPDVSLGIICNFGDDSNFVKTTCDVIACFDGFEFSLNNKTFSF